MGASGGANIGGNPGFEGLHAAFLQALIDSGIGGGGGGGGGGETFPDAVVTGTGAFVVPVGFNAIVRVECGAGAVFSIGGVNVLTSNHFETVRKIANAPSIVNISCGSNAYMISDTFATLGNVEKFADTGISVAPDIPINQNYTTMYTGPGATARGTATSGAVGASVSGVQIGQQSTRVSQTFKIPEGTSISGGSARLVELYAI